MFKFEFELEDAENTEEIQDIQPQISGDNVVSGSEQQIPTLEAFTEIPLSQLLDALPALISYSPLTVLPSSSEGDSITLARRDLFDARFQLISGGKDVNEDGPDATSTLNESDVDAALGFLDAPSDLVPGVYEGGLKTWECSLDLVGYLAGLKTQDNWSLRGKRLLEIGCGTAVPSLYLLNELFSTDSDRAMTTHIHLQDYNRSVLELVTFPNMILAWYMSPASTEYRELSDDPDTTPPADPTISGELPITPSLKTAFLASLTKTAIVCRFFSGSWQTFDITSTGGPYDVVLTSETIYRMDSLHPLINLLRASCGVDDLSDAAKQLSLSENEDKQCHDGYGLCLVAAKVLYFGVGGGVSAFVKAVEASEVKPVGRVKTVWERNVGVGRKVMHVVWEKVGMVLST